jgi:hypothetical protein
MIQGAHNDTERLIAPDDCKGENGALSTVQLTEPQFRAFLQTLASNAGSMAELARRFDVSGQFIGEVISGNKRPGKKLLDKMGGRMMRVYLIPVETQ